MNAARDAIPQALLDALSAVPDLTARTGEPASRHTRLRVGGPAALWLVAETEAAACSALKACKEHGISSRIWPGEGVLVRDGGLAGATLRFGAVACGIAFGDDGAVQVGADYPAAALAVRAAAEGRGGLAELSGRAGTVADAWRAGLLGKVLVTARLLRGTRAADCKAEKLKPTQNPITFTLALPAATDRTLRRDALAAIEKRRGVGDGLPGRVMADPKKRGASPAAEVIADAGLCGVRLRSARIGVLEPNAILTQAGASARDVLLLTRMMKDRVFMNSGVELQPLERPVGRS